MSRDVPAHLTVFIQGVGKTLQGASDAISQCSKVKWPADAAAEGATLLQNAERAIAAGGKAGGSATLPPSAKAAVSADSDAQPGAAGGFDDVATSETNGDSVESPSPTTTPAATVPSASTPQVLTPLAQFAYRVLHGAVATGSTTSSSGIAELNQVRAHGRDLALLVAMESLQVLQDYARLAGSVQGSSMAAASRSVTEAPAGSDAAAKRSPVASGESPAVESAAAPAIPITSFVSLDDAMQAFRACYDRIFLGLYSPRAVTPPAPTGKDAAKDALKVAPMPSSIDDTTVRHVMKLSLEGVKAGIRISCHLQDAFAARASKSAQASPAASAQQSPADASVAPLPAGDDRTAEALVNLPWLAVVDSTALPLYYLLHVAADDGAASTGSGSNAPPPIPNTIVLKTKSDARSLLYQLVNLAMKQTPTQRLAGGFSKMSLPELSKTLDGLPVAGFALLDALARAVGDGEGGQSQLALRVATDALTAAATDDQLSVRWLFDTARYSKSIVTALVAGVMSPSVTTLGAALRATLAVLKEALVECRQDMGFLHCNALLRLLDAESNNAPDTKEVILKHLAQLVSAESSSGEAILEPSSAGDAPSNTGDKAAAAVSASPSRSRSTKWPSQRRHLLIDLYAYLDLDPRLHSANLVSQVVASLCRLVRTSPAGLTTSALAAASGSNAPAAGAAGQTATPKSARSAGSDSAVSDPAQGGDESTTLPHRALLALSRLSETLAIASQQDALVEQDDRPWPGPEVSSPDGAAPLVGRRWVAVPRNNVPPGVLARLRQEKLALQRHVDVINLKPEKLATLLWGISKDYGADIPVEEFDKPENAAPEDADEVAAALPSPSADATAQSVNLFSASIGRFVAATPSLNPSSVGEYLSGDKPVPARAAYYFMKQLDLGGRSVAGALRELFAALALPKEGQRIERLLEAFSNAFYDANAGQPGVSTAAFPFKSRDAAFVLIVATVMLHTDLHNPRVETKMTKQSFSLQLSRCNDNEDFPPGFAADLFDTIAAAPFSNAKGIGAVSVEGPNSTQIAPQSKMDFFFFSREERRDLLFTLERRRIFTETKELVARKTVPLLQTPAAKPMTTSDKDEAESAGESLPSVTLQGFHVQHLKIPHLLKSATSEGAPEGNAPVPGGFVPVSAVTRELFSSTWGSLYAVFSMLLQQPEHLAAGVAMPGSPAAGSPTSVGTEPVAASVLQTCVKGLQDLLYAAAVFGCQTEAEAALTALLRVSKTSPARRAAIDSVFFVASSPFAPTLGQNCWVQIVSLCAEAHELMASTPKQSMSPAALAMSAGIGAVYSNLEASLRLPPLSTRSNNFNAVLGDVAIQAVMTSMLSTAASDLPRLGALFATLKNILRAFAAADLAVATELAPLPVGRAHVLASLDTLTGLFVTVLRVHSSDSNATATITAALEDVLILALGVEGQLEQLRHRHSEHDDDAQPAVDAPIPPPVFGLAVEAYRCVQASQSSSTGAGGQTSAAGSAMRVRIAVMRTIQSVISRSRIALTQTVSSHEKAAEDRSSAEASAARPAAADEHNPLRFVVDAHIETHGTLLAESSTHINMLGALVVEASATTATGLGAELRAMATMALHELLNLATAVARLPPVDAGSAAAAAQGAKAASTPAAALSSAADHIAKRSNNDEHTLRSIKRVLPLPFVCVALAADATSQTHCAQHASAVAKRAALQILAIGDGDTDDTSSIDTIQRCITDGLELLLGSSSADTRLAGLSLCQWLSACCVAGIRQPRSSQQAERSLSFLEALCRCSAAIAVRGLPQARATELVRSLADTALLAVPSHVISAGVPNACSATALRNSATFSQLLVVLSCDVFGSPSGPRFDTNVSKSGMPTPLPWQDGQRLAQLVIDECVAPLLSGGRPNGGSGSASSALSPAPITCQTQAAKCLTRVMDRSLVAFGNSPAANDDQGMRDEADFVLGHIAQALSVVRMPPAYLAAFLKFSDGTQLEDLRVFSDLPLECESNVGSPATPWRASTATPIDDSDGAAAAGTDDASAAATTLSHQGSRSGHVTAEEAAAAYHAFCSVGGTLFTFAANIAHRAAPLPEVPALSRLIRLCLASADDVIALSEYCPQLTTHSAFVSIRTRPLFHAPASVLHWCLVASIRLMFARWRITLVASSSSAATAGTPTLCRHSADDEQQAGSAEPTPHEAVLHATTVNLFEAFARFSRVKGENVDSTSPEAAAGASRNVSFSDGAKGGASSSQSVPLHAFRAPLAEVIRDWGLLIASSCQRVKKATEATSPSPARGSALSGSTGASKTAPPQWPVLRRPDVFQAAVSALMAPECPAKVVAAVARYLTLFHAVELKNAVGDDSAAETLLLETPPPMRREEAVKTEGDAATPAPQMENLDEVAEDAQEDTR